MSFGAFGSGASGSSTISTRLLAAAGTPVQESAGSGNLYSLEFFRACAKRLRPGGLMCTWAPTPRVRTTFRSVFTHVLDAEGGVLLIGSEYPLQLDPAGWQARLEAATPYLGELRAQSVRERLASLVPASGPLEGLPNRDLEPLDEFGR